MRILVTGAAGFIGSTLCDRLVNEGHKVAGADCFLPGYPAAVKKNNICELVNKKNFELIEINLLKTDLRRLLSGKEIVFHLAAQAGVRSSWGKEFKLYTENNVLATQKLLEAAKGSQSLRKFVFASSSSVYGDQLIMPIKENAMPIPMSPYGVTKLAAERLCGLYWKNYGVPSVSLRFFSVYGPRQRPDMAFNIFIRKMLKNETLPVFSGGRQTRDFTYVEDIVSGAMLAAKKGKSGEVYNLGGGNRISLNKVINKLEIITGKKAKILTKEIAKGDVKHTWASIAKARKDLGYSPET
ncbi:MAG: NAD-dependent epimerase/dehydratase family protein, partial [Candidatus Firestonebacteria bacterium]